MFSALEIAKYMLWYCTSKNTPISNLKLQKMLYFVWIDCYKDRQENLFIDDICAWQFGPVVPVVYFNYCQYACLKIYVKEKPANADRLSFLDTFIDRYRELSIFELVEKTHLPGTPWHIVYQNGKGRKQVIQFSLIKKVECNSATV